MKKTTYFLLISTFFITSLFQVQASDINLSTKRKLENEEDGQPPKKKRRLSSNSQPTNTSYQNHNANSSDYIDTNPLTQQEISQIYNFLHIHFPDYIDSTKDQSAPTSPKINVNIQDSLARTPLMIAIKLGYENIASLLIRYPKTDNVNKCCNEWGYTPLLYAIEYKRKKIIIQLLKYPKTNVNQLDQECQSPLMLAVRLSDEKTVSLLLERDDINPNEYYHNQDSSEMETALVCAVKYATENIFTKLMKHPKIDVNNSNHLGETPLICAAQQGEKNMASQLIQNSNTDVNADIYCEDCEEYMKTALMYAIQNGHANIAIELIKHPDIDVNQVDSNGNTALFYLSLQKIKNTECLICLVKKTQIPSLHPNHVIYSKKVI